jgi:multiple sugar transport system permease protein
MIDAKGHTLAKGQIFRPRATGRRLKTLWKILSYAVLLFFALTMLVPFLWMLSTSLKADQYVLTMPPQLIPRPLTLSSYQRLFELFPMGRMFFNSLLVAVVTTLGQILTGSMAAYAFARMRFRGRDLFILMRYLGWINTYPSLIAPGIFTAFGTFLLRQFFLTIPRDLEDAAFIDGASHWTVFRRVIMPLSGPALATLGVFAFMSSWNAYLWPLFVVNAPEMMTLPVGLATLHGRWLTEWNLVMAGAVITVLPMLVVYLAAQKYFVQGVVLSGIKG